MSPLKKKKLDSAIDALFSSPRSRASQPADSASLLPKTTIPTVEAVAFEPAAIETALAETVEVETGQASPVAEEPAATSVPANPVIQAQPETPVPIVPTPAPELSPDPVPAANDRPEMAALQSKPTVQMVIFTLDGQYYGIDIAAVESIIKVQAITLLPHVPAYNLGLTNLRGKVLPVFSLRRRFGIPDQESNRNNRIIVIHIQQEQAGLLVDAVTEVATVLKESIEPAPAITISADSIALNGIARLEDRLVILPDLDQLLISKK